MSERKIDAAKRRDYRRGGKGSDNEIPKYHKKKKKTNKPYVILWKFENNNFKHILPKFSDWSVYKSYDDRRKRDQAFQALLINLREGLSIKYMKDDRDEK